MVSVKTKIEKWLAKAPKEISITDVNIDPEMISVRKTGDLLPIMVSKGYYGTISFKTMKYEEE